jgi:hypothetical protein
MNENIKYQKKPVYDFREDTLLPSKKKIMACISQLSSECLKKFSTTPEKRICSYCTDIIQSQYSGEYTKK